MAAQRKVREEPREEGAPAWALTFGDLMTQLLTFFILLFSVSEVKQQKIYEVFQSFRTYFKIDVPVTGYTIRSLEQAFQALTEKAFDVPDEQGKSGRSEIAVDQRLAKYLAVEVKDESVNLTIAGETLFEEGKATLLPGAKQKLEYLAEKLVGYWTRIKILGHTSPLPLPPGSPFRDHFSLGYARAKAVSDVLVGHWREMGHPEEALRLEIASRGRNDPPRDTTDIARYDRVEIIVTAEPVLRRDTLRRMGKVQLQREKARRRSERAGSSTRAPAGPPAESTGNSGTGR